MFCPQCGCKLPDNMAFCTSCGARLTVPGGVSRPETGACAETDASFAAPQPDAPFDASGYGASQPYQQPYQQQYQQQYQQPSQQQYQSDQQQYQQQYQQPYQQQYQQPYQQQYQSYQQPSQQQYQPAQQQCPPPHDPLSQAPYQQFAPANAAAPTGNRKKRTALIISVSVVAVLVVVAAVGFFTGWFGLSGNGTGASNVLATATSNTCNVQCHSPMDYYVEDFADENSTSLASLHCKASSLAATSATPKDVGCTDCHTRSAAIDATEQSDWSSGNYSTDADGKLTILATEVMRTEGTTAKAFCTRCHDYDKVTASTENWGGEAGVNPHNSHQGELGCTNCHSAHDTSKLYCNSCHTFKLPAGWEAPSK